MKKVKIATALFIFIVCLAHGQYNDCKEYGFKGPVKRAVKYKYTGLEKRNNEWIVDERKLNFIQKYLMNEDQNIETIKTTYPSEDSVEVHIVQFEFMNNFKVASNRTDENGNIISSTVFKWFSDKNYMAAEIVEEEILIEYWYSLNDNYRDHIGECRVYLLEAGIKLLYTKDSYKSFFEARNERPIKTEFYDADGNITSVLTPEIKKIDSYGNLVEYALIKEDGSLDSYIKVEFDYKE